MKRFKRSIYALISVVCTITGSIMPTAAAYAADAPSDRTTVISTINYTLSVAEKSYAPPKDVISAEDQTDTDWSSGVIYASGNFSGKGIWVKRANGYTEDNPMLLVRVVDSKKGTDTEIEVDPRKISMLWASPEEMAALIAYADANSETMPIGPAMVRIIGDNDDLLTQTDLSSAIKSYAANTTTPQNYLDLLKVIDKSSSHNAERGKHNPGKPDSLKI